jgi:ferredoxin
LRDGYLRANPGNPAAMLQAVLGARDLIGTFEKPRYIAFDATLCAHSVSEVVGCTRCLGLCPTNAITPAGDHVTIDANICAGCGQCASACPTGAASYALPPEDALMRRLRAMLDGRIGTIETDDPDSLIEALRAIPAMHSAPRPANFRPVGKKRDVLRFALGELHRAAAATVDIIALSEGAPLGAVEIDVGGCTLCLSCVSACPTGALRDGPERPMLRFVEGACVQCGLCQATCPEKVITLKPQIDFRAARAPARILKEEEPFCCISCGKPVRCEEHDRAGGGDTRKQALDVHRLVATPRRHQDVRGLSRRCRRGARL